MNKTLNRTINATQISDLLAHLSGSEDEALHQLTEEYLKTVDRDDPPGGPEIKDGMLDMIRTVFEAWNGSCGKGRRFSIPKKLKPFQICSIMLHLYDIKLIDYSDDGSEDCSALSIYMRSGPDAGIYVNSNKEFDRIICEYDRSITSEGIKEVKKRLRPYAEKVVRCPDPDLIAVNNGIFDYNNKELLPFDPKYVFIAKLAVDYNENAKNVVFKAPDGTSWDIESWIKDLFEGKPDLVETAWQLIGACIRPGVDWAKAAWLISTRGNNGKGTFCQLIRNIIGPRASTSIRLADFEKNFFLTDLLHSMAIITDENDVGISIPKCSNLKAVITHDPIMIDRKFQDPVRCRYRGFMIQCVNSIPCFKDKTESLYRRMLLIPFDKCFTGAERKYIKNDYINKKEVKEYVLYKVLHMRYYEISEPECCKRMLMQFKGDNEPIREFLEEVLREARIDFLPTTLLWDLYRQWITRNAPGTEKMHRNRFYRELRDIIATEYPGWEYDDTVRDVRRLMEGDEPLLREYNLKEWMDDGHMPGRTPYKNAVKESRLNKKHRGWRRIEHSQAL